jgi:excisionase family DNA binding protein
MPQEQSHSGSSQEPNASLLLTIPQVAKHLGISRAMVYILLAKKEGPPVIRLGRSVRVSAASLRKWIEDRENEQNLK